MIKLLRKIDNKLYFALSISWVILYCISPIDILPELYLKVWVSYIDDVALIMLCLLNIILQKEGVESIEIKVENLPNNGSVSAVELYDNVTYDIEDIPILSAECCSEPDIIMDVPDYFSRVEEIRKRSPDETLGDYSKQYRGSNDPSDKFW